MTLVTQRRSDNSAPELSEATLFSKKKKIIMLIQQKQCSACKHLEENISFGNMPLNFFL